MSDMPEHVRGEMSELIVIDAEIDELFNQRNALNVRRAGLINDVARRVAKFEIGQEFEGRKGNRFRLTNIVGDYVDMRDLTGEPITWVRYKGVQLFKNGNVGKEEIIYPADMALVKRDGRERVK